MHKKTVVMNIVGAVCIFFAGTAVFLQQLMEFEQTAGPLAAIVALYATLVVIAALLTGEAAWLQLPAHAET